MVPALRQALAGLDPNLPMPEVTTLGDVVRRSVARPRFAEGFDAVVMGHIHIPTHVEEDNKHMFFLGDWITEFTYLVMENGAFEPRRWET